MSGASKVIAMAERLGITSELRDDPSLALGSSEVSLLELTAAYAEIANGGRLVWPEGDRAGGRRRRRGALPPPARSTAGCWSPPWCAR